MGNYTDTTDIMKNIVETWHLEAKQESDDLFYYIDEVNLIKNGKKSYVIGRKGMGKTAISEYLYSQKNYNVFTERLTFKNFPFNVLYDLDNSKYTSPNQYITIWKYLIYNTVCKMMSQNENLNSQLLDILRKMYSQEPIKALNKLVPRWTANGFGVDIMGCGASVDGDVKKNESLSWIEKCDVFEDIIEHYGDDSYYYVLIDELDEDYRDFEGDLQKKTYIYLITSLFKAVQDIKAYFKDSHINIRPVIFLRSDIYSLIKDSDKNKWSDYKLDLKWNTDQLKNMICHRLYISSSKKYKEKEIWNIIFPQKYIYMGNKNHNRMNDFDYISRSTHWRPRDYIHYVSECAKLALEKKEIAILSHTIKEVDREFSEYLKGEITDEIYSVIPNIDSVFNILSQIRKQTFSPQLFLDAYEPYAKYPEEGKYVLLQLFEHGVIGNQPSMKGQQIFKHQYPNALFNMNENVIIHRGLYKSLQIF
jgi:hypothetical protein